MDPISPTQHAIPITLAIIAHTLCGLNFAFSSRPTTRRFLATVNSLLALASVLLVNRLTWYADPLIMYMMGFILHTTNYLCLNPVYVDRDLSLWGKLWWSAQMLFSPRHLPNSRGKEWEQTKVRELGESKAKELGVMDKNEFLLRNALLFLGAYVVDRKRNEWIERVAYLDIKYPKEQMFRRVGDVGFRDFEVRFYFILYSLGGTWCEFTMFHSSISLITVGLFNDCVSNWPPLFGSITQAYSMRRFWSHFWHRLMRKAFVQHSKFWLDKIGIRERKMVKDGEGKDKVVGSKLWVPAILVMSFVISGGMHSFVEAQNAKCWSINQVWYHLAVSVVILLEDMFQRVYFGWKAKRRATSKSTKAEFAKATSTEPDSKAIPNGSSPSRKEKGNKQDIKFEEAEWWEKVVGFLWVYLYYSWAIPKASFPAMRCF